MVYIITRYGKWLDRTGKCVFDKADNSWFITYIDRDPMAIAAQKKR